MSDKAKRRLTDIKFDHEGGHVALVGKHQGGPANGISTLVFKATNDVPNDIVEKATQVSVTMDFEEFLVKFFNMYYEDAEILAKLLGFEEEEEDDSSDEYESEYKKYIDERVAAISIMKSVYSKQDVKKALSELSYKDSLAVLEAQELLEKALSSVNSEGDNVSVKKAEMDSPSTNNTEDNMEMIQKALHEELVTKAVTEAVEVVKAEMAAQEEVLKAVQAELEVFKAAQKEAIVKARKEALAAVLAEDAVEDMFKATEAISQEAFDMIVKSLAAKTAQLEESELFKETGVPGQSEQDPVKMDGTAAILKAKYQSKK
jgi:hypothetical protein